MPKILNGKGQKKTGALAAILLALSLAALACGPSGGNGARQVRGTQLEIASLTTLDSYRLRATQHIQGRDGFTTLNYTEEWVKSPPARHFVMVESTGLLYDEYFVVSDTIWMSIDDVWTEVPSLEGVEDIQDNLESILYDTSQARRVGEEPVNGIQCTVYTWSQEGFQTQLWLANQSDLPPVPIRLHWQASLQGVSTEWDYEVDQVNQPLSIKPPR